MAADTDHYNIVERLAERHEERIASALVKLEDRVADLMATAPLRDGQLFDLEWALNARPELRQAIREEYLTEVDSIIRDYSNVADDAVAMLGTYGDITELDRDVISQLQKMTFQGLEDLGTEYLDILAKQVYESTLTGTTFAASVAAVKATVADGMGRYVKQQVHDSLTQFDRTINAKVALDSGAEKFTYRGPDDESTRDFCDKHVNKTYTIDEIKEIWQGEWTGKSSSNAFATAGGYNCRHRFRPVFD
jgi:hypothetical protein